MWKDFCSFRSSLNGGNLLKVLDTRLARHRAEVKAKREASERKKIAKQETEKKKKEREEKEKKEVKSMEQLMSLMTENSNWEHEENDVVLWKYSTHVSNAKEDRVSRKKTSAHDDNTSCIELTNQRSLATKSTNQITTSLGSENFTEKASKPKHRGTSRANSTYSRRSVKATDPITTCIPGISQSPSSSKARDITSYEVTNENSSNHDEERNFEKNKLLKKRKRNKSKNFSHNTKSLDLISNVENKKREKYDQSPLIKEVGLKSHVQDSTAIELEAHEMGPERRGSLRTSELRRQWNDRSRSQTSLTAKLLRDFTNSPEGAPLDNLLSLAHITVSDEVHSLETSHKAAPNSTRGTKQVASLMSQQGKHGKVCRSKTEQFIPDVIVN